MKKLLVCALALMMSLSAALAEGKSYEGTVVATKTEAVLASGAGVIGEVAYQAGERVAAGEEVARLTETTVYAQEDGWVTMFGDVGESVDTLTDRYGAAAYILPVRSLSLTGSTSYAYDAVDNKNIQPGEIVYLATVSTALGRTGKGMVTAVNGTKYTVEVLVGDVLDEDTVYIYRDEAHTLKSRIGRGTISWSGAEAVEASGVISSVLVKDDQLVQAGTPLFTTVDASAYDWQMIAPASGVVASVAVSSGDTVEAGTLIAEIYPDSAMRLQLLVEARDLRDLRAGSEVEISFDNGVAATGKVERVSGTAWTGETDEDDDTVYFAVYVTYTADEAIPCGMTARISLAE